MSFCVSRHHLRLSSFVIKFLTMLKTNLQYFGYSNAIKLFLCLRQYGSKKSKKRWHEKNSPPTPTGIAADRLQSTNSQELSGTGSIFCHIRWVSQGWNKCLNKVICVSCRKRLWNECKWVVGYGCTKETYGINSHWGSVPECAVHKNRTIEMEILLTAVLLWESIHD